MQLLCREDSLLWFWCGNQVRDPYSSVCYRCRSQVPSLMSGHEDLDWWANNLPIFPIFYFSLKIRCWSDLHLLDFLIVGWSMPNLCIPEIAIKPNNKCFLGRNLFNYSSTVMRHSIHLFGSLHMQTIRKQTAMTTINSLQLHRCHEAFHPLIWVNYKCKPWNRQWALKSSAKESLAC